MRPVPDIAVPNPRKSSSDQQPQWIDPRNTVPTSFFLSHQDPDLDAHVAHETMYGVQSLEDASHQSSLMSSWCESEQSPSPQKSVSDPSPSPSIPQQPHSPVDEEAPPTARPSARRHSTIKPLDALLHVDRSESAWPISGSASPRPTSPLTPSNPEDAPSLPSSPKSISNQSARNLDEISIADDMSSQAVASGEEDDESRLAPEVGPDSTSQLIMPMIKMPSRRPFTDHGKALGRLKVLFAGASGSGKTSLLKSIVQECEDIVHVDSLPSTPLSLHSRPSSPPSRKAMPAVVSEIYASTKPYPAWWSDLEDSRVLRRRKSTGDVVLERNLCFVDTPQTTLSRPGQTDAVLQYIRQQLLRAAGSLQSPNHDFQNLLAGNGGAQVDAVLYLISTDTLSTDVDCIRKLCDWTSVVPVIAKSDLLTSHQISTLKSAFHNHARDAGITPFLFGGASDAETPFAVSSAKTPDDDEMDASTLMSPDYVQPLVPSELSLLVQKLFDRENMAWLRHSTAKKLSQRLQTDPRRPGPRAHHSLLSRVPPDPRSHSPGYTMARVADYTRQEEKEARVHLAKWASDLQQSLQNERERYAALARAERAVWLTERLGECVVDGSLVPITQTPGFSSPRPGLRGTRAGKGHVDAAAGGVVVRRQHGHGPRGEEYGYEYRVAQISAHDPLGVVEWTEDLRRRGWALVQIVGSFGVVGGLALWLAKAWGVPASRSLSDWRFDWYGSSGSG
ncbi:hypothetical protein BDV59DRAFT_13859 [Aspergillus ambiguus]|uniref:uncharacterized protein n=1 Tax=Aspergillus ambiguus TaxID=176160 RepID=UPI003CCD665A